jgi:hypothetical protein
MKYLKVMFAVVVIAGLVSFLPMQLFAQDAPDAPEDIKMLRDAAKALKSSDPELANKVNIYADMEQEELLGREGTEGEAAMLKTAAKALEKTNPELANKLNVFADKEIKIEQERDNNENE